MSEKLLTALFQERVGRFVGRVLLDGQTVSAHIKNTGRCRELLYPGATVLLRPVADPSRKTKYDLAIVRRADGALVSIDSTVPNAVAAAYLPVSGLFSPTARILREKSFGSSRFDLYVEDGERRAYVEVKGVTLCEEQYRVARFPDAPTERGVKHLRELIECVRAGYEAYLLFVVQTTGVREVRPNDRTHPVFGETLRQAKAAGVGIMAIGCRVYDSGEVVPDTPIPVIL